MNVPEKPRTPLQSFIEFGFTPEEAYELINLRPLARRQGFVCPDQLVVFWESNGGRKAFLNTHISMGMMLRMERVIKKSKGG